MWISKLKSPFVERCPASACFLAFGFMNTCRMFLSSATLGFLISLISLSLTTYLEHKVVIKHGKLSISSFFFPPACISWTIFPILTSYPTVIQCNKANLWLLKVSLCVAGLSDCFMNRYQAFESSIKSILLSNFSSPDSTQVVFELQSDCM